MSAFVLQYNPYVTHTPTDALSSLGSRVPYTSPCLFEISVLAYVKYVAYPLLFEELVFHPEPQSALSLPSSTRTVQSFTHNLPSLRKSSLSAYLLEVTNLLKLYRPTSCSRYGDVVLLSGMSMTKHGYCWGWLSGRFIYLLSRYVPSLTPRLKDGHRPQFAPQDVSEPGYSRRSCAR